MFDLDTSAIHILNDKRRRFGQLRPLARHHLARNFGKNAQKNVLMVYVEDAIAWPQFYPFFHFKRRFAEMGYAFRGTPYPAPNADRLVREADAIFVQSPYVWTASLLQDTLKRLRDVNPDAMISYFDWFAPTDIRFADQVADHVDYYCKKSLMRDRSHYLHERSAHTNLEEYYAPAFQLIADKPNWTVRPDIVDRLTLVPGFATAPAFIDKALSATSPPMGERSIDVHARFSATSENLVRAGRLDADNRTHWYVRMRNQCKEVIASLEGRYNIASRGFVSKKAFMQELTQSKTCFSPFGFGELCWRDIEAILSGSVLIKQSMEHLDCFCDIYRADETYVPVRWDLSDLDDVIAGLINQPERRRAIAENAYRHLHDYLSGPKLGELLAKLTSPRI